MVGVGLVAQEWIAFDVIDELFVDDWLFHGVMLWSDDGLMVGNKLFGEDWLFSENLLLKKWLFSDELLLEKWLFGEKMLFDECWFSEMAERLVTDGLSGE